MHVTSALWTHMESALMLPAVLTVHLEGLLNRWLAKLHKTIVVSNNSARLIYPDFIPIVFIFKRIGKNVYLNKIYLLVCPLGAYINANNNGLCEQCPIDTYGPSINVAQCTDCPTRTNTQGLTGRTTENSCSK